VVTFQGTQRTSFEKASPSARSLEHKLAAPPNTSILDQKSCMKVVAVIVASAECHWVSLRRGSLALIW